MRGTCQSLRKGHQVNKSICKQKKGRGCIGAGLRAVSGSGNSEELGLLLPWNQGQGHAPARVQSSQ